MTTIRWINGQAGGTPLSAENLNLMQQYIQTYIDDEIEEVEKKTEKNIITAWNTQDQNVSSNTKINLLSQRRVGTKLSLENSGIVIGSGVSKVKVSGSIFFEQYEFSTAGYLYPKIARNEEIAVQAITQKESRGNHETVAFPPAVIDVQENDKITLNSGDLSNSTAVVRGRSTLSTWLTVEVVE